MIFDKNSLEQMQRIFNCGMKTKITNQPQIKAEPRMHANGHEGEGGFENDLISRIFLRSLRPLGLCPSEIAVSYQF
jgi:hypothetical protein